MPTAEPKKILITGGAGFIGSHLAQKLVALGHRVTIVDDLSRGSLQNLSPIASKFVFFQKDLREESGLRQIFEGHVAVFNLAALNTGIDYDQGRMQESFETNMMLQMVPLRVSALTKSVNTFIQMSSASVYSRIAMEQGVPTPEDADTCCPEPSKLGYALAKKMGEQLAQWYYQSSTLRTIVARPINAFGENDNFTRAGHFIPVMIRKILLADDEVVVFGSGKQKRSFLYVKDLVDALVLLMERGEEGAIYNIDSYEERAVIDVVKMIMGMADKGSLRIICDRKLPEGSKRRMLNSSKIRALGWAPQVTFREGLKKTIRDISERLRATKA